MTLSLTRLSRLGAAFVLFALPSAGFGQGFDLGGSLENNSSFSFNSNNTSAVDGGNFSQSNKGLLWLSLSTGSTSLSAQGSYLFDLDTKTLGYSLIPQLDSLILESFFTSGSQIFTSFALQAGRIRTADPTRLVLNQTMDGISFRSTGPAFDLALFAGYNGFLSKKASSMVLTNSDITDQSNLANYFATPRLVAQTSVKLKSFWAGMDLNAGYIFQQDLRNFITPNRLLAEGRTTYTETEGGLLNTHHAVAVLSATPLKNLYLDLDLLLSFNQSLMYDTSGTTSKYAYLFTTGFAGAAVASLYSDDNNASLKLRGIITSGDNSNRKSFIEGASTKNAVSFLFKSLNNPGFGTVFSPQLGNLMYAEAVLSFKPFSKPTSDILSMTGKAMTFFRSVVGPISVSNVAGTAQDLYLGTEADLQLSFRPLSDVGLFLTTGLFFPNTASTGAFYNLRNWIESKTVLYCSLSF